MAPGPQRLGLEVEMEPERASAPEPADPPVRLALVIGNSSYRRAGHLKNPASDARAIAAKLVELGYHVRSELDLDGNRLMTAVADFIRELAQQTGAAAGDRKTRRPAHVVLYYAGHGVQVRGENYLLPVDGEFDTEADLKLRTVRLDDVIEALAGCASTTVVLLDCCRNNPLPRALGPDGQSRALASHHGLAGVEVPNGAFVAFATQPDAVAEVGQGANSPFTTALVRHIGAPDTPISEMMIDVRREVYEATSGRQIPWDRSALFQPFAFHPTRAPQTAAALPTPEEMARSAELREAAREQEYWALTEKSDSMELLRSFVLQFPYSVHRPAALARIDQLRYRKWRNDLVLGVASAVLGIVAIFLSYLGIEYSRFSDANGLLVNADIIGNDIELPIVPTGGTSMAWCRIECIFDSRCTAISWAPGKVGPDGNRSGSRCYTKLAAVYFVRPNSERGDDDADSEYVRRRGVSPPRELPAGWTFHWDRTLVGDPVAKDKVLADPKFLGPDGRAPGREDRRTNKYYWRVSNAACHQRCEDLGQDCKGFSFTPLGYRCQLFQTVRGIARDPEGNPVHTPSVQSACNALDVEDCRTSQ